MKEQAAHFFDDPLSPAKKKRMLDKKALNIKKLTQEIRQGSVEDLFGITVRNQLSVFSGIRDDEADVKSL